MTVMISEVYDALTDAGASEEKARKAASVLADYNNKFADIQADMQLLKWVLTAQAAVMLLIGAPSVWLLVRVAAKVGAIG